MRTPVRRVALDAVTIADVANLYLDELVRRAEAGQVSWNYCRANKCRLERIVPFVEPDLPLAELRRDQIANAIFKLAARPPSLRRPYDKPPFNVPIRPVTAKHLIRTLKALLTWVSESDLLRWDRPRDFNRLFRTSERKMMNADDRERESREVLSGEVKTFTNDELLRLFRAGRQRDRLIILLGLNCGFTSGEMASLRDFEVHLDADPPYIHKRRAKTGVEAKWILWPETVALLRRNRAPANSEHLWLLTDMGRSLVEVNARCRRDGSIHAWNTLLARSGIARHLGCRFLRKTGADAIKRLGGLEESEMYLAHQEPGINKHYANRNWDRMWSCLKRYREQLPFLGPAWDLEPSECLFTQGTSPDWSEVNPPFVQRVNKRSQTGLLNVSFNTRKRKYYARLYYRGRNYTRGYFKTAEQAARVAAEIRASLQHAMPPPRCTARSIAAAPAVT